MSRHSGHTMSFQQKDPRFQVTEELGFPPQTLPLLNFAGVAGHGRVSREKALWVPMVSFAPWEL